MADLFSGVDDGATQMPTLPYAACHSAAPPVLAVLLPRGCPVGLRPHWLARELWGHWASGAEVRLDSVGGADAGDAGHAGEGRGIGGQGGSGRIPVSRDGRAARRRRALAAALARPGLFGDDSRPARLTVDFNGGYQPPTPTTALPGTMEKLLVMRERAKLRQQLHHPLDARRDGGGR